MFVGNFKTPIQPNEKAPLAIEFTGDLPGDLTISSIEIAWSLVITDPGATVDATPQSRLDGEAVTQTQQDAALGLRTFVVQTIKNAVDDNQYRLEAVIERSDGKKFSRYGHVWCRAPRTA